MEVGPASIALGDADPAVAVRRIPVSRDTIPVGMSLGEGSGLAGILQPTFFGVRGDTRTFGAAGLGDVTHGERSSALVPVARLTDGSDVVVRSADEDEYEYSFDPGSGDRPACASDVGLQRLGTPGRRTLQTGGCLVDEEFGGRADVTVAGGRILSRVTPLGERRFDEPVPTAITTVSPDGTGLRTLVSGTYRGPRGLTADGSRIGWWERRCAGGQDLVVAEGRVGALRACTLRVLSRNVRVRRGRLNLRVQCARGCRGRVVDRTRCGPQGSRRFTIERGSRTLRVPIPRRSRRRALLRIEVEGGPSRFVSVRLR